MNVLWNFRWVILESSYKAFRDMWSQLFFSILNAFVQNVSGIKSKITNKNSEQVKRVLDFNIYIKQVLLPERIYNWF